MTTFRLQHHLSCAVLIVLVMLLPALSHAADGVEDEWYGWQIMPVDAVSLGVMTYTIVWRHPSTRVNNSLGYASLAGYTFGAPIVHLAHGQWWRASGSLGLRLGLPMLGALTASAIIGDTGNAETGYFDLPWLVVGAGVGVLSAMALDAAFLAHKPTSPQKNTGSQTQLLQLQWQF